MYEKAIGEFGKVRDSPGSSEQAAQALLRIGDCYYHLGSYLEAFQTYLDVTREFPESREAPEAEYGILLALKRQGRDDDFMERANTFFSRYPDHPIGANVLTTVAQYYWHNNQVESTIAAYRELLKKYSQSDLADDVQFNLGEIYREQRDFQNAILEFGQVVKQYPRSDHLVDAYFEIAQGYFALGDYRRALEGYDRVVKKFPNSHLAGKADLRVVDCLEKLDRVDLAEKRLIELMGNPPDSQTRFQAALRVGLILFETMRYGEAIEVLREATKSGDREVASLAQLKIGEIYREIGVSSTAIVELMKVIYLYPSQMRQVEAALFEVGGIYVEQKRWTNARQVYSKVIETSHSDAVRERARRMLAEIDRKTGNE
jgi:TolA-binding protein